MRARVVGVVEKKRLKVGTVVGEREKGRWMFVFVATRIKGVGEGV